MNATRVDRLAESDWRLFAALRLRALGDTLGTRDPQHESEAAFTAAQWRRRLRSHAQFAAFLADRPVGLIGAQQERDDSVYLYSLWLEPEVRGHGLAATLLRAAIDWARDAGARTVTLRVHAANDTARAVYAGLGFVVAGPASDAAAEPTDEIVMVRDVS